MKLDRPHNCPELELTGRSTATTYHFRCQPPHRGFGWALCTVNDRTGELLIMSDWGNWSFRWHTSYLGPSRFWPHHAQWLTEFIGDRSEGSLNYLADKLTSTDEQREFDPWETVKEFKRRICEKRLEWAREHDYDEDDGYSRPYPGRYDRHGRTPLTRAAARELWDALTGEIADTTDETLFIERFQQIEGWNWISNEPWECTLHKPSFAYLILLHGILPALRHATMAHLRELTPAPPSVGWAGDLAALEVGIADDCARRDADMRAAARREQAGL